MTYELGKCKSCGKESPLKNGRCFVCNMPENDAIEELLGGLFGKLGKEKK